MAILQPDYMGGSSRTKTATPGQQFNYFMDLWGKEWKPLKQGKETALEHIASSLSGFQEMSMALAQRQSRLAQLSPRIFAFEAINNAPMMTGMGLDHPLENGFAFLRPYGLPYLPGASVKGVLRVAAEELALGLDGKSDWNMWLVWLMFGLDQDSAGLIEGNTNDPDVIQKEKNRRKTLLYEWAENDIEDSEISRRVKQMTGFQSATTVQFLQALAKKSSDIHAFRGGLDFWDVLILCSQLDIDILTPHQTDYYQKGGAPHDCGQPVPNPFLVVAPKSRFRFHIQANGLLHQNATAELTTPKLQSLLQELMQYACNWLGFGAKTSLGYGAMTCRPLTMEEIANDAAQSQEKQQARQQALEAQRQREEIEKLPADEKYLQQWKLEHNPDTNTTLDMLEAISALDNIQAHVIDAMKEIVEQYWKGILDDPDAVQGKKQKPKYKERPKNIAKFLLQRSQQS